MHHGPPLDPGILLEVDSDILRLGITDVTPFGGNVTVNGSLSTL